MSIRLKLLRYLLQTLSVLWLVLPAQAQTNDFSVTVTIKPVHSIISGLMVGLEPPQLLIEGQQVPYGFEPSAQQLQKMASSSLFIWVGPELESGLSQSIQSLPQQVRVVELLSNPALKILPSRSDKSLRDPFFWLDDRNTLILLDELTLLLQQADPLRAHVYARNRRQMKSRLVYIDRVYEYGYRGLKAGLGVQYYDTLQYFEQAYALGVIDRVVGSPDHQADAAALLKVRQRLQDGDAVCLLTERGWPMDHISLLTDGTGVIPTELDSLGIDLSPGPELYYELMERNTVAIKRCLGADMDAAELARKQAHAEEIVETNEIGSGPFMLTDHLGQLVSPETMRGKYQLLYFGYTYCPDICPTSLAVQAKALDLLGDKADYFQPYFVTIDPERDTVKVMREYVKYFDKRLIGVTGTPEMVKRMADQFKVKFEKVLEETGDADQYLMDHSASIIVLSPQGRFLKKFLDGVAPKTLHDELLQIIEAGHSRD